MTPRNRGGYHAPMPEHDRRDVGGSPGVAESSHAGRESADSRADCPDRWVAAAAFTHPIAAHIARTKLEFDGFACYLDNELFVTTAWLYSIATGGVKVMVRESDLAAARESLQEKVRRATDGIAAAASGSDADLVCPHCGSTDVDRDRPWTRLVSAFLILFAAEAVVLSVLGIPLVIAIALRSLVAIPRKCGSCGHYWWGRAGAKGFEVVHRPAGEATVPVPVLVLTPPPATGR